MNSRSNLRPRQSRRRRSPLNNYYRSGATAPGDVASPFQKPATAAPGMRLKWLLTRTLDAILIAVVLIALGYSLMVSSNPKVEVNSTVYHSAQNYHDSARHFLKTFKNRNKLSFDEQSVVSGLMNDYPEIASASVELPVFSQQPVIHIQIAAPSFILVKGSQNFVIDADGKAIGTAEDFKGISKLPRITDQTSYQVSVPKAVLAASDVAFVKSLLAEAAHAHVNFDSLTLPNTAAELDAKPSGEAYFVKFYLGGDAPTEIGQFLAAKHQFDSSGNQPSSYLDVRVTGKVFYK